MTPTMLHNRWKEMQRSTDDPRILAHWLLDNQAVGLPGTSEVIHGLLALLYERGETR